MKVIFLNVQNNIPLHFGRDYVPRLCELVRFHQGQGQDYLSGRVMKVEWVYLQSGIGSNSTEPAHVEVFVEVIKQKHTSDPNTKLTWQRPFNASSLSSAMGNKVQR